MHNIEFELREMHVIPSIHMNRIAMPMGSILWRDYDRHFFTIYDITVPVRKLDINTYAHVDVHYNKARALFPHSDVDGMLAMPALRALSHKELNRLILTFDKCIGTWGDVPSTWCDPREAQLYRKQAMTALKSLYRVERSYSIVMFERS